MTRLDEAQTLALNEALAGEGLWAYMGPQFERELWGLRDGLRFGLDSWCRIATSPETNSVVLSDAAVRMLDRAGWLSITPGAELCDGSWYHFARLTPFALNSQVRVFYEAGLFVSADEFAQVMGTRDFFEEIAVWCDGQLEGRSDNPVPYRVGVLLRSPWAEPVSYEGWARRFYRVRPLLDE